MGLILLIWLIPLFQFVHPITELKKLSGSFTYTLNDTLTHTNWFNGTYTANKDKFLNEQFGFRNFFVRSRNSVFFSVFRVPTANGVVIGKDNFLYEEKYINSYIGKDFIGQNAMKIKLQKLKFITDTLKKINVDVILAFAPGKATYYPEYIPDSYFVNCDTVNTNYKWAVKISKELGLNYIDYNALFKAKKTTSKFPLFPKTGIHWSVYASYYAFDTLITYIEKVKHKQLPHFRYDKVKWSYNMMEPDEDIALALNTLVPPKPFEMPYPIIEYCDTMNKYHPKIITIADSYWGSLYYSHITKYIFEKPEYWYFYSQNLDYGPGVVDPLTYNLKTKIENTDVIFLLFTESHIGNLGYGFIEDAYALYTKKDYSQKDRQYAMGRSRVKGWILTDPKWMFNIKAKAKTFGISFDSMMTQEADLLIKEYNMFYIPEPTIPIRESIIANLKNIPELINDIKLKSKHQQIPIDLIIEEEVKQILNTAKKVNLLASNNKYICADISSNNMVAANRVKANSWETFSLLAFKNKTYALSTHTETFFSISIAEQNNLNARGTQIGSSETFTMVELENNFVAFKVANGYYLSLDEKSQQIFANAKSIGEQEKFKLIFK
ncbi:MAG: hypothetical protein V4511_03695 [Bacteroidota bacterium]